MILPGPGVLQVFVPSHKAVSIRGHGSHQARDRIALSFDERDLGALDEVRIVQFVRCGIIRQRWLKSAGIKSCQSYLKFSKPVSGKLSRPVCPVRDAVVHRFLRALIILALGINSFAGGGVPTYEA